MNGYTITALLLTALLAGCAGKSQAPVASGEGASSVSATLSASGERYVMSGDAYPVNPPDVSEIPDAVPRVEPLSRGGNRPVYEVWGKSYRVLPEARGYAQQGNASWYGEKFHGYATSNGEIYDMYKMTAAHRSLPLPSYVRVTSLDNGRSVIVRVNDRGPFHSDREIDLSYAAAARLDILERGTGRVKVEAIDPQHWLAENANGQANQQPAAVVQRPAVTQAPETDTAEAITPAAVSATRAAPASSPAAGTGVTGEGESPVFLQVAALGSAESARALQTRLQGKLSHPVRVADRAGMYRVQVGPLAHAGMAGSVRDALRQAGFEQSFIVNGAD
ncbi:MAG TPA: septal ring lytic transglycosylase RlpA family protein [Candidatus Halomonas stercoripullorum]|uniref:Endolytic peptidoglycan transglycosylase RlpA n=1 Tax=Candidatus Halomonas stercoripullorum TaxID=2838617 RepID=A0A9D1WLB4_9GAMM|nr:septal ring lytic transglycosylase RlpA family protein [Candidatus Halomonas stercoripullorum]